MSCANHKDFDPRCHACLDSAAGTVAFDPNFMLDRIAYDRPSRTLQLAGWLAFVPMAYRADAEQCVRRVSPRFVGEKMTDEVCRAFVHALHRDIIEHVPWRDPAPDPTDILASGPIRPHIPCPHGAYSRTSCMTCNREDGRIGGSGVVATHVEGREAPMEACEMPASSGGAEWVATVEACARAALDGYEGNDPPMYSSDWGQLPEDDRDAWRDVARAVLAAAGRGGK